MTLSLTPYARRVGAVAVLLALVLIAWNGAVQPVIATWRSYDRDIARQQALLMRYQSLDRDERALQNQLKELQSTKATPQDFIEGGNANLVLAKLQSDLKAIIESHHGQVHSAQVLPLTDEDGFKKLGVRFDLTAGLDDLTRMLYEIETRSPALFLDNVNIQAGQASTLNSGAPAPLTVRFDVFGYMRSGTP